jgi:hypothetical protein
VVSLLNVAAEQAARSPGSSSVQQLMQYLQAVAVAKSSSPAVGNRLTDLPWTTVSPVVSYAGLVPPALWQRKDNAWTLAYGQGEELLCFQRPLKGDFEVEYECRPGRPGKAHPQLVYGGMALALDPHGRHYLVHYPTGGTRRLTLPTPLWPAQPRALALLSQAGTALANPGSGSLALPLSAGSGGSDDWVRYRLTVSGNVWTWHIDGRRIHEQRLRHDSEPWLWVKTTGAIGEPIRNLRLRSDAVSPAKVELSLGRDLTNWRLDAESASDYERWLKRGAEIYGPRRKGSGDQLPSYLYYHRPLLEEGVVEYEFFYQRGKTHVHPVLGGWTFLLPPEGLAPQRVSSAAPAPTANAPQGQTPLPLKEREWNRVQLALRGTQVTLRLNGQEIGRHNLEPGPQPFFGFFRHAETEARIRNVRYQGEWTK